MKNLIASLFLIVFSANLVAQCDQISVTNEQYLGTVAPTSCASMAFLDEGDTYFNATTNVMWKKTTPAGANTWIELASSANVPPVGVPPSDWANLMHTATALTGDLSGTMAAPIVDGIRGVPVSATAPTVGQALVFNGIEYAPAAAASPTTYDNGLTKTGNNVKLGGPLTGATTVTTTAANTLAFSGLQNGALGDSILSISVGGVVRKISRASILALDHTPVTPNAGAPGGIASAGSTSLTMSDGNYSGTGTLPTAAGRRDQIFVFRNHATFSTIAQILNTTMTATVSLATGQSLIFASDGVNWVKIGPDGSGAGGVTNINQVFNFNDVYDTLTNYVFVDESHLPFNNGAGNAFIKDGQVWCWGANGSKSQTNSNALNLAWQMSVSPYKADGSLVGYTPVFKKIAYSAENVLAIDQAGNVWVGGTDTWGQMGDGATTGRPLDMLFIVEYFQLNNIKIADILTNGLATYGAYWYARTAAGVTYFCGNNTYGIAGDGTVANVLTPKPITLPGPVAKIRTGGKGALGNGFQTFFLFSDATVPHALGYNAQNQLGDGTVTQRNSPTPVPTLSGATDIVCGGAFTGAIYGITAPGNVKFAGNNGSGAHGKNNLTLSTTFTDATTFTGVAKKLYLAEGTSPTTSSASAIISSIGEFWVAGNNAQGFLGEGVAATPLNIQSFVKPPGAFQGKVAELTWNASGAPSSAIRDTTGEVWCAGYNQYGAKGQGNITTTFVYQNTFHKVHLPFLSVKIHSSSPAGGSQAAFYALTKRGTIYNWGASVGVANTSNLAANILAPKPVILDGIAQASGGPVDSDNNSTNELQNLIYAPATNLLSLSSANSVDLKKTAVGLFLSGSIAVATGVVVPLTGAAISETGDLLSECVAGVFTPTVTGLYEVSGHVEWAASTWASGNVATLAFSTAAGAEVIGVANSIAPAITVASNLDAFMPGGMVSLTAGTSYRFHVVQNSGAAKSLNAGARAYLSIKRL